MKKILLSLSLLSSVTIHAQYEDSIILKSFADEIMLYGQCYEDLRVVTKKHWE